LVLLSRGLLEGPKPILGTLSTHSCQCRRPALETISLIHL
jgi:hypothetical protein